MEYIKISKLLSYHELLRCVPVSSEKTGELCSGLSNYLGQAYTSHEVVTAEGMVEIIENATNSSRILVVHDKDLDGVVSSLILEEYLTKYCKFETLDLVDVLSGPTFTPNTLEAAEKFGKGFAVFILDHAFRKDVYSKLAESFDHVVWVDHHPVTEQEDIDVRMYQDTIFITPTYSTAELTWRMTSSARSVTDDPKQLFVMERIAYMTHFHDTWQYKKGEGPAHERLSKDTEEFAAWFDAEAKHTGILRALFKISNNSTEAIAILTKLSNMGSAVLMSRKLIQSRIVRESVMFLTWTLGDEVYKIGLAFHSDARSQLAQAILTEHSDKVNAAIVAFYSDTDGKVRFSMRGTSNGPAVNVVCEAFGGGGHRNAAGFTVDNSEVGNFLKDMVITPDQEN